MAPDSSNLIPDEPVRPAPGRARGGGKRRGDRYSRFVVRMKYLLPAAAALIVAVVLLWPLVVENSRDLMQRAGELAGDASPLRNFEMANPRYEGVDEEGRPFRLTAAAARQNSLGANLVTLQEPRARVTLESGNILYVTAQRGVFNRRNEMLVLTGDVNFFHDGGYTFKTERADINLTRNTAHGDRPVIATGPKGTLEAEGFRVSEDGRTIRFTGHAVVRLNLTDRDIGDIAGPERGGQ